MTPVHKSDEFGNFANSMYYRDFCRFAREFEPQWDATRTNKEWAEFTKRSY